MSTKNMTATQQELADVENCLRAEILELRQRIRLLELKIEVCVEAIGDINAAE